MTDKFKEGAHIAPRNYPLTPGAVLSVLRYEDGDLIAYPASGGMQCRFDPKTVRLYGFVDIGDAEMPKVKANFYFDVHEDDSKNRRFSGIDDGQRWNGWAVPLLDAAGMRALADDLQPEYYALEAEEGADGGVEDLAWVLTQKEDDVDEDGCRSFLHAEIHDGKPYWRIPAMFTFDVEPVEKPVQADGFLELISAARECVADSEEFDPETIANAVEGTVAWNLRRLSRALELFNHVQV